MIIIDNLVNIDLQYYIIEKRKSVLYAIKKDISHLSILKQSVISQKIDLKINLINILTKSLLNIL